MSKKIWRQSQNPPEISLGEMGEGRGRQRRGQGLWGWDKVSKEARRDSRVKEEEAGRDRAGKCRDTQGQAGPDSDRLDKERDWKSQVGTGADR